jgi:hypothetical protein
MTIHSFPKALETAAPSDRGVKPLGVPVASIIVRYSVASDSSRVGNDGWARVRYTSCGPSPLFRQGRAGFLNRIGAGHSTLARTAGSAWSDIVAAPFNLGRYLAGWSSRVFSTLRQLRQEARGVLSVLFSPSLSVRFIHADKHGASDVRKIRFPSGEIRNVVR